MGNICERMRYNLLKLSSDIFYINYNMTRITDTKNYIVL